MKQTSKILEQQDYPVCTEEVVHPDERYRDVPYGVFVGGLLNRDRRRVAHIRVGGGISRVLADTPDHFIQFQLYAMIRSLSRTLKICGERSQGSVGHELQREANTVEPVIAPIIEVVYHLESKGELQADSGSWWCKPYLGLPKMPDQNEICRVVP